MFQILKKINTIKGFRNLVTSCANLKSYLPEAYHCNEVWAQSLCQTKFAEKKINLDELYYEIDQRFQQTRQVSPVDVAVFSNSVKDDTYVDELLDLIYKLRLSAETTNTLSSTSYTVLKTLLNNDRAVDIINVLDDRVNYGVFADHYALSLLLDYFLSKNDFSKGAKVASQIMLQEYDEHPVSYAYALLHCYNCLVKKDFWEIPEKPTEPEEKVRIKYIRNPYDDQHFDLREPEKIIGKTLMHLTKNKKDSLNLSFNILGLVLFGKSEEAFKKIEECKIKSIEVYSTILNLMPEENELKKSIDNLNLLKDDVEILLQQNIEKFVSQNSEKIIADQCKKITEWDQELEDAIKIYEDKIKQQKQIEEIAAIQKDLEEKERRLWFFENEEKMELEIERKKLESSKDKDRKSVV